MVQQKLKRGDRIRILGKTRGRFLEKTAFKKGDCATILYIDNFIVVVKDPRHDLCYFNNYDIEPLIPTPEYASNIPFLLSFGNIINAVITEYGTCVDAIKSLCRFMAICQDKGMRTGPQDTIGGRILVDILTEEKSEKPWLDFALKRGWIKEREPGFQPFDITIETRDDAVALLSIIGPRNNEELRALMEEKWDEYLNESGRRLSLPAGESDPLFDVYCQVSDRMEV